MIVFKFGGSSVASLNGIKKIKNILNHCNEKNIVIFSAIGKKNKFDIKLTDHLIKIYEFKKQKKNIVNEVNHVCTIISNYQNLLFKNTYKPVNINLLKHFLLNECDYNSILAVGEHVTCKILSIFLDYKFIDATSIFYKTENKINLELSKRAFKQISQENKIAIPGFYYNHKDKVEVFKRGGGDISGSIAANISNANCYYNCTDVNGLLKLNDGLQRSNNTIKNLSYGQFFSLIKMGINLFSINAIIYCSEKNIPIYIANTFYFNGPKTLVDKQKKDCFIILKKEKILLFYNKEKTIKSVFIKGIFNNIMTDIMKFKQSFYYKNKLILIYKNDIENNHKKNQYLLPVVIFSKLNPCIKKHIQKVAKKHNIDVWLNILPFPFNKTIIYFYGEHIDENFNNEIFNILNKYFK